jgi:hypothetical protein
MADAKPSKEALSECAEKGHTESGPCIASKVCPMMIDGKPRMVHIEAVGCLRCGLVHWVAR